MSTPAPRLSGDELIARAEALIPVLAARAGEAERLRRIPDETIADLREAGLLRIAKPPGFGGYGLDFDCAWEVGVRLARGCGSTAWVYMVSQIHDYQAGVAPPAAQEAFFADPDLMSSSAFAPTGLLEPADGGWLLSGSWGFSSGADHARWHLLGAVVPGVGLVLSIVAREDAEIVDDWHVSGLCATGSKTIRLTEPVFVSRDHWIPTGGGGNAQMRDQHARASYGSPLSSILSFALCAPLVGMTQAALDAYVEQAMKRRLPTGAEVRELATVQARVAESAAELDAAATLCRALIAEHAARGERGPEFTLEDRARFRRTHAYVARLCRSATDRLFDGAGGHAIYDANPLQRLHRDVNAAVHQVALGWDDNAVLYGRVRLGLEPAGLFW
ncbi:MAG TPA: acyl-CoA dehydrogenase family protein [Solirubrobacteraceae bacterium]|jgi:3-hydroxy-9,10-secoandrosta-1,3,5(10)-triene-9,17-dione monooxygenase